MTTKRPKNILFIWTDQQRPDTIGAYGNPHVHTPHLDRLVEQSSCFEQAYCSQPVCAPARATALTGLYPHTHGVVSNGIPLDPDVPVIAELLRPAGLVSGHIGMWHLAHKAAAAATPTRIRAVLGKHRGPVHRQPRGGGL